MAARAAAGKCSGTPLPDLPALYQWSGPHGPAGEAREVETPDSSVIRASRISERDSEGIADASACLLKSQVRRQRGASRALDPPHKSKKVERSTQITKAQVRRPLQQAPESPRTPRGATHGKAQVRAAVAARRMVCTLPERQTSVAADHSRPLRRTECAARPDEVHPALLGPGHRLAPNDDTDSASTSRPPPSSARADREPAAANELVTRSC